MNYIVASDAVKLTQERNESTEETSEGTVNQSFEIHARELLGASSTSARSDLGLNIASVQGRGEKLFYEE